MKDLCVKCGLCEAVCPSRLSSLRAIDVDRSGRVPDESVNCTTCNLCVALCPRDIQITKAIEKMRKNILTKGYRETLYNLEAYHCSIVPDAPLKVAPIKCDTAYFAGCLSNYRQKDISRAVCHTLEHFGIEYTRIQEVCCGSPLNRIGRFDLAEKTLQKNLHMLRKAGVERVITSCPGCTSTLLEYQDEFEVVHYLDLYDIEGIDRALTKEPRRATLQYPCHLYRNVSPYTMIVAERVLSSMFEYERMPDPAGCCGAGGGVRRNDVSLSRDLKQKKVADVRRMRVDLVASACPQCNIHLSEELPMKDIAVLVAENMRLMPSE